MNHIQSSIITPGNLFAGGNTYVLTFGAPITTGSLVTIAVGTETRTVSSIAGTNLTLATTGDSFENVGLQRHLSLWQGIASGACSSVTITLSGNHGATAHVGYIEMEDPAADQSGATANGSANAATSTHNSGSVTPPSAVNAVVAAMDRNNGTWHEDGAFTQVSGGTDNFRMAYLEQTSATAQEYNVTQDEGNGYSAMRIGAFAGVPAGTALSGSALTGGQQAPGLVVEVPL